MQTSTQNTCARASVERVGGRDGLCERGMGLRPRGWSNMHRHVALDAQASQAGLSDLVSLPVASGVVCQPEGTAAQPELAACAVAVVSGIAMCVQM